MATILHIKNMVCPRCIEAVQSILYEENIETKSVELGKVEVNSDLNENKIERLGVILSKRGFELLKDKNHKITDQIKSLVIEIIHHKGKSFEKFNFSSFLSEKLNIEYKQLSTLFSSLENITIEKYIILQKIEKVKELISYGELNLSEIAFHLGYSSVHHLSNQFKKITGITPTQYYHLTSNQRKTLDKIEK